MHKSVLLKVAVMMAGFTFGAGTVRTAAAEPAGGDWPKWLGPNGNGISTEKIAEQWPEGGPKKLWSAKVGLGFSSAVAQDGKIYFFSTQGDKDVLSCFDAENGTQLWTGSYANAYQHRQYPGTRATPAIDGDRIFTYGGSGQLVAWDLKTGKQLWDVQVLKVTGSTPLGADQWGQASSPLVYKDRVVVQAGIGGPVAIAANKADGKVLWQSEAKGIGGYAHVIVADVATKPQLIVFGGTALYGMDPADGKTLWQQPWKTSYDVNAATPIYDGKGNLFISSGYKTGSAMFQLTPTGATRLWVKKDIQDKFPAPILDDGALYAISDEGRGPIKAIEWPTGKLLWELKEAKLGFGGSILRVGGDKMIAQAQSGELYLIKATPKEGKIISSFPAFEGAKQVWSMPIVYKGKLYAKGPEELVCFDIK